MCFWMFDFQPKLRPVVDVKKVTTAVLCYAVRLKLYATSGGVKPMYVLTPLDGSAGIIFGRKNVL